MKIRVTFKTPNMLREAYTDLPAIDYAGLEVLARMFVKDGESVTIVFDTVEQTAEVVRLYEPSALRSEEVGSPR